MQKSQIHINPVILRWAMDDVNISPSDLARKLKVKEEKVRGWMQGTAFPTYNQLEKISYEIVKIPLAAFFLDEIPIMSSAKKKFRSLPESIFIGTSYQTLLAVKRAAFLINVLQDIFKTDTGGTERLKEFHFSTGNAQLLATEIRQLLKISSDLQKSFLNPYAALNYYRAQLENIGIFTFQLKLEEDRAFCLLDPKFPVIILNSGDSPNSKIFSLFHEFIHIILDSDDIFKDSPEASVWNPTEIFCNKVTAEILVPEAEIRRIASSSDKGFTKESISQLSKIYKVSQEVILRRFLDLNYVSQETYLNYKKSWDTQFQEKKSVKVNYYAKTVSALGKKFILTVITSYKMGDLSDSQVTGYLNVSYNHLNSLEAAAQPL